MASISVDTKETSLPDGVKLEPAVGLPTKVTGDNEGVTSRMEPLGDEAAEGGSVVAHPFRTLLRQVGYSEW